MTRTITVYLHREKYYGSYVRLYKVEPTWNKDWGQWFTRGEPHFSFCPQGLGRADVSVPKGSVVKLEIKINPVAKKAPVKKKVAKKKVFKKSARR